MDQSIKMDIKVALSNEQILYIGLAVLGGVVFGGLLLALLTKALKLN